MSYINADLSLANRQFGLLSAHMRAAALGRASQQLHKASFAPGNTGGSQACLPFVGQFIPPFPRDARRPFRAHRTHANPAGLLLHDVSRTAELPTLLDPTAPDTAASVDSSGRLLAPAQPAAFDDHPPLPASTPLAPLVNVHKFRRLAETVRTLQTFQELSKQYTFKPVSAIYLRCLKLRVLDGHILHELSLRLEP